MRKLFAAAMGISVAIAGISATPAAAQAYQGPPPPRDGYAYQDDDYQGDGYQDRDGYSDQREYRDPRQGGRYQVGDTYRGPETRAYRGQNRYYRGNQRCGSGTTGAIIGGVLGALVGGEVGRGNGYYSRRSGTGTIVGAGAGALIGREIDRGDCNDHRRGYRRR